MQCTGDKLKAEMTSASDKKKGRLAQKVAIITGGTSGIGMATAMLFAAEGGSVVFTGRRQAEGRKVEEAILSSGGEALFIPADHTVEKDCRKVVESVVREYDRLDILFNNAGIVSRGTAEDTTEDVWESTFQINVTAVWMMSRLVLPVMRAQGGGVIINNASDWGLVGGRNAVAYCASKGAVIQITRAMALDHAGENIRINAVCPGDIYVSRWKEEGYDRREGSKNMKAFLKKSGAALPMGRVGRPEEVARAVLFLASEDSEFMTGTAVPVDGGNTAM
jgi:NAD(P)-dependent dehydrogenase (short-subunit alcohol dehydrogenase family)